ncbi:MAG TPA: hypothetical protein VMX55_09955 [candidate division Zixibacteria bacterium]|nr:hypothetical protein [candidate division Zixibacteria bacterium]
MEVKNFYRFNVTSEQSILKEQKDDYFGLTISAHLALFYKKFFSTYLRELDKPFFIDTVTYVFARDLTNTKKIDKDGELSLKKSYQKLIDYCDGNIKAILDKREFIPKDFFDNNGLLINEFTEKIISLQKDFFSFKSVKSFDKYDKILGKKTGQLKLLFLTAPYFYFESINDPWYKISLNMAQQALTIKDDFELYVILCFSKDMLLHESSITKMIDDFSGFDGYIFWISDFNEKEMTLNYLTSLISFIKKIAAKEKPVFNLYGEYFSLILSKMGLNGYSRGLGFSENKFIDACVTGGGQPKRFYSPLLHYSVSETNIVQLYSIFPRLLCDCYTCQSIRNMLMISTNPSLNDLSLFFNHFDFFSDSKKHLASSHTKEIKEIEQSTLEGIINELEQVILFYDKNNLDLYSIKKSHLINWLKCLKKYSKL